MGKERRRVARLESNLFAEIENEDGISLGRGVVTDVSLRGVAFATEADLPINGKVTCLIEIPLDLKATIVRGSRIEERVRQYGLRFDNMSIIERFLVRRLLKGRRSTRKVSSRQ